MSDCTMGVAVAFCAPICSSLGRMPETALSSGFSPQAPCGTAVVDRPETVIGDSGPVVCPLAATERLKIVKGDTDATAWLLAASGRPTTVDGDIGAVVWPLIAVGRSETVSGDIDAVAWPLTSAGRPNSVEGDNGVAVEPLTPPGRPQTVDGDGGRQGRTRRCSARPACPLAPTTHSPAGAVSPSLSDRNVPVLLICPLELSENRELGCLAENERPFIPMIGPRGRNLPAVACCPLCLSNSLNDGDRR